ncbi:MAG: hypothetical protein Q8N59_03715, partial [bacterium]|nr:hypothetical protein [bacterium]
MRQEKEHFPKSTTKSEEAVKKLEEAFDESIDLSPEEIEKDILSIEGAEEGRGLKQMREKSKEKK